MFLFYTECHQIEEKTGTLDGELILDVTLERPLAGLAGLSDLVEVADLDRVVCLGKPLAVGNTVEAVPRHETEYNNNNNICDNN